MTTYIKKDNHPICINYNCEKYVEMQTGHKSPKSQCGHCAKASRKLLYENKFEFAKDVIPFKTGICSNVDCPVDLKKIKEHCMFFVTELDHIDGNPWNNIPDNVQELCAICHKDKSIKCGDLNSYKRNNPI